MKDLKQSRHNETDNDADMAAHSKTSVSRDGQQQLKPPALKKSHSMRANVPLSKKEGSKKSKPEKATNINTNEDTGHKRESGVENDATREDQTTAQSNTQTHGQSQTQNHEPQNASPTQQQPNTTVTKKKRKSRAKRKKRPSQQPESGDTEPKSPLISPRESNRIASTTDSTTDPTTNKTKKDPRKRTRSQKGQKRTSTAGGAATRPESGNSGKNGANDDNNKDRISRSKVVAAPPQPMWTSYKGNGAQHDIILTTVRTTEPTSSTTTTTNKTTTKEELPTSPKKAEPMRKTTSGTCQTLFASLLHFINASFDISLISL